MNLFCYCFSPFLLSVGKENFICLIFAKKILTKFCFASKLVEFAYKVSFLTLGVHNNTISWHFYKYLWLLGANGGDIFIFKYLIRIGNSIFLDCIFSFEFLIHIKRE
jgi:hypothetical protein